MLVDRFYITAWVGSIVQFAAALGRGCTLGIAKYFVNI